MEDSEFGSEYANCQMNRSSLRKFFRKVYLLDVKRYVLGSAIDFGCGIGELLEVLPEGSLGLDINKTAVDYARKKGMNAELYNPKEDRYRLKDIKANAFQTFVANHVLEHIDKPAEALKEIFESCWRLGIKRIIITVPGRKGFLNDVTHKTFINLDYLQSNGLLENDKYRMATSKYFPFNHRKLSEVFTHNELRIVFDRVGLQD